MLDNGLTAAERTRNKSRTSLGDRVEGINGSYARLHNSEGTRFLLIPLNCHFYRPFLAHCNFMLFSFGICENCNGIVDSVRAFSGYAFNRVFSFK